MMANRRMIAKNISISEQVNSLPLIGSLLYTWMIPHADDWGRMLGSPAKIRAMVFPMRDDVKVADVTEALQQMQDRGLIDWYEIDGEKFVQFPTWEKHQSGLHKRTPSKFPGKQSNEKPVSETFPEVPGNSNEFSVERELELELEPKQEQEQRDRLTDRAGTPSDSKPFIDRIRDEWRQTFRKPISRTDETDLLNYHAEDGLEQELILKSLSLARDRGAQHANYVWQTLLSWIDEGITTVAQFDASEEARKELIANRRQVATARTTEGVRSDGENRSNRGTNPAPTREPTAGEEFRARRLAKQHQSV